MTSDRTRWSRRKYILASTSVIAASGMAGCSGEGNGDDGNNTGDDNGTDSGNGGDSGSGGGETANAIVGEVVEGEGMELVVRSVERTTQIDDFQEADSGNTFVILRMAVKNTTDEYANFSSHFQATLENPQGNAYEASFSVTDNPLQSGLLASGEITRGDLVFEVPEDDTDLTLSIDLSSFDLFNFSRIEVDLTEEADEAGDIEQSLNVDVNSVGDSVTHEDVTVTVHNVRTETELGEFSQADDGMEYVIPEIEVENGTSEELQVSTLLQMAMKTDTGLSFSTSIDSSELSQTFSEQQPIPAGDNRRGELAYEVPQDREQVYWAYNFLEFSSEMKAFWQLDV